MGKEQSLIEWADAQPEWVQDALRRHAISPSFQLSDADKAAVVERVCYAAGAPGDAKPQCDPLSADHLSTNAANSPRALLCSLGPVANLGRLAAGQKLSFALDGITLIYGDNGSGKSGYCRITKKLCRSLTSDDLLGNVFEAGEKPPAQVVVRYLPDGAKEVVEATWIDGTPPPADIANISVFDSRNARFYVDQKNQIGFLPAEISLLECHGAHRKEMDATFQTERKALEVRCKVPLPGGYTPGGEASTLLSKLALKAKSLPTKEEIEALGAWTDANAKELDEIQASLAKDPAVLSARCARAAAALETIATTLSTIAHGLSSAVADTLATKVDQAASAAAAATLAADAAFKDEPIPNVGRSPWRLMYEHAKAFAVANGGGPELASSEGDLCLLCQQPLSAEAGDRLTRFRNFVNGQASAAADTAATELRAAMVEIRDLPLPTKISVEQSLAEYQSIDEERRTFGGNLVDYIEAARVRKSALLVAAEVANFGQVAELPESLADTLANEVVALKSEGAVFEEQAKTNTKHAVEATRLSELKDRQLLHNGLATVLARHDDLAKHSYLLKCEKLVGTLPVSTMVTSIRRKLVTDGLEKRIESEIAGLDLAHIPFAVSDQSRDGRSLFEVGIKSQIVTSNDKVLSEGEQRALALACFLAEVAADGAKNGLVVDDPVSSLDHLRIRRVAARLVAEAARGRQVVVFTHNMLFYNEMIDAAAASSPSVALVRRIVTKSETEGFGLISETDEPWIAQRVVARIERLKTRHKALSGETNFGTDAYRRAAKDFYTDLRETWERLVEELLLGKVVERFSTDVKTQSLKGVVVEDEDYKTIYWAMKRVSERSGHDMAAGKGAPPPTPTDMKSDIDTIEAFRGKLAARRKKLMEDRDALEKPPVGKTA